jgi:hypothetical protein
VDLEARSLRKDSGIGRKVGKKMTIGLQAGIIYLEDGGHMYRATGPPGHQMKGT